MILVGDYIPKMKQVELNLPFKGTILANLEGPVVGDAVLTPSLKAGPNLKSRSLGTERTDFIFNLANNHTMDYGAEGLHLTQDLLRKKGIPFVGAGDDIEAARKPIIVEEAGKKIGIIGCCERQFGCADEGLPGCAEKGLWLLKAVADLKKQCDFVIVSSHVAFEHSPLPSPRVREFYKLLIDAGADVIHGHHAHIPQGWEAYGKGVIFYGLGNFVVDPVAWTGPNHRWSVVVQLDFAKDKVQWETRIVGVEDIACKIAVSELSGEKRVYAEDYLATWNGVLKNSVTYLSAWQNICTQLYDKCYGIVFKTPYYKGETKRLSLRHRVRYMRDGLLVILGGLLGHSVTTQVNMIYGRGFLNFAQCESHYDAAATALGVWNHCVSDGRLIKEREELARFFVI